MSDISQSVFYSYILYKYLVLLQTSDHILQKIILLNELTACILWI